MSQLSTNTMGFGGKVGDCAFVDVRVFGPTNASKNTAITKAYSKLLNETLGIPTERVYLTFTSYNSGYWGHDDYTF